jgi:phosphopentomutase
MAKRIVLVVLDGVGVGKLPDAAPYNDKGADSLGHIFDVLGTSYSLPNLGMLGLYKIINTKINCLKLMLT